MYSVDFYWKGGDGLYAINQTWDAESPGPSWALAQITTKPKASLTGYIFGHRYKVYVIHFGPGPFLFTEVISFQQDTSITIKSIDLGGFK